MTLLEDKVELLSETIHRCPMGCYYLAINDIGTHEIEEFNVYGNLYVYGASESEYSIKKVQYTIENHYQRNCCVDRRQIPASEWSLLRLGADALYRFDSCVPTGTTDVGLAKMLLSKGAMQLMVITTYEL